MKPRFYFTTHPKDLSVGRLVEGSSIMLVASAHWDDQRNRFRLRRPPHRHIHSICIDSGGFTAAKRWGRYPWTPQQYAGFINEISRDVKLDFCAIMDYACEPNVNRSILATNRDRIKATIRNEYECIKADPNLPWLPVLQGDNLIERAFDLRLRTRLGILPKSYAGIGSVCGRGILTAREVINFYTAQLPGVKYHGFGLHVQALDDDATFAALKSWDSYSWNWGPRHKEARPVEYLKRPNESWANHTQRLASLYWNRVIKPRLEKERQLSLNL